MSAEKYLVYLTGLSTYALIVWGGYVTLGGYGLGCGTYWPTCNGMLIPTSNWAAIAEYVHRILTIVTGIILLASTVAVWKMKPRPTGASRALAFAIALLFVQSLIGGDVVVTALDPIVATVHLAFATAVLATIIFACAFIYTWDKSASAKMKIT